MNDEKKRPLTYEERVEAAITAPIDNNLPDAAPVVAMFLEHFRPAHPCDADCFMTSMEIVQELEDTCSLTTKDVALTMTFLGYRLHLTEDSGPEWAMQNESH